MIRNINDAIKEADGDRLNRCYRIAVLYFKCYGHTKYAYTVLKMLFRIKIDTKNSFNLIWNRFINNRGLPGRNISQDLHLEHLNNFLKELFRSLRSNFNEANAERISKAFNNVKKIVENAEKNLNACKKVNSNNNPKMFEAVRHLVIELNKENPFNDTEGVPKDYESFPEFDCELLGSLDIKKLLKWAKVKKAEFEKLYA